MPVPQNSEIWAFRDVRGTKEKLIAKIAESSAPDAVKAALDWAIRSRTGDGFRLDSFGHSGNDGEIIEHTHITRLI